MRSLLFVPGGSPRKYEKAAVCGADGLILDLEDSVGPDRKTAAREHVGELLRGTSLGNAPLYVRINPLTTDLAVPDLTAVIHPGIAGVMLPKAEGAADLRRLSHYLDVLEEVRGIAAGSTRILIVATETPTAMFALGSYAGVSARLAGLTWGAEDLATAMGAASNKDENGNWGTSFAFARHQCLFAAAHAGVAAIDTLYADFRDADGLALACSQSRRDGFSGRIAIHPDQVQVINQCFSPSEDEIAEARQVMTAFLETPGAGVVAIDGRMYDIPHLKNAQRILAAAGE